MWSQQNDASERLTTAASSHSSTMTMSLILYPAEWESLEGAVWKSSAYCELDSPKVAMDWQDGIAVKDACYLSLVT